jgi:hypothetical protein
MTAGLKENCGFKRKVDLDYPPIQNLSLINVIARQSMNLLLFEEATRILQLATDPRPDLKEVFQESLSSAAVLQPRSS